MREYEKIAEETLKEEIRESEREIIIKSDTMPVQPLADPTETYYKNMFYKFFSSGYWTLNKENIRNLELHNKLNYWSNQNKLDGWSATYAIFRKSVYWKNTETMREQFYCHARLGYAAYEKTWNLEPHKTSINALNCN